MKRGGFCGVMGPRMSLNTDLEKVFKSYTNQVENIKKKNEHREKLKHGDSYINREICNISGDSNIFNLSGEDCETREELFKKCVNDMLHSSSPDFQKHILYLDCNNLYGSAQCLPMPLNNFQWVEVDMIDRIENFFTKRATDFNRGVPTQSWDSYFGVGEKSTGYFIECDLNFTDKCKNKEGQRLDVIVLAPRQVKAPRVYVAWRPQAHVYLGRPQAHVHLGRPQAYIHLW